MEEIEHIELFFHKTEEFLVNNNLEKQYNFIGHSDEEIVRLDNELQSSYGYKLPFAYKYFLKRFAKGGLSIFDSQDYSIEEISTAISVAKEIIERDKVDIEENAMVFSQWQGYNFTYLLLGDENPYVKTTVEGDGSEGSAKIFEEGSFTNWITTLVERDLYLRKQLDKLNIDNLLKKLTEIRSII